MYKIVFFILTFWTISAIFYPKSVSAQETRLDLTASPVFFDFTIEPGREIKDKIRIRNNSSIPINLKTEIKKITASDVREANLEDPRPEDIFISWIKIDNSNFTANPREYVDIPFTITVPRDAAFGYYFTFVIQQDIKKTADQPTAIVQGAAAIPVLLNVKSPNAKAEAQIIEFTPLHFINEYLPVEFLVKVKNTGNVHLRPRGNIFILGHDKKELAILEVNESMSSVLPEATRPFSAFWDDGFLVKTRTNDDTTETNKEHLKFDWDKLTKFRFGPYIAHLLIVYDDGKRDVMMERTATFWVIPYTMLIISVISIIVFILVTRFIIKAYIRRELKKHRVSI